MMTNLPPKLQEIIDDFSVAARQEKTEMLIAYAESLPPFPDQWQGNLDKMEPVLECMTHVFLAADQDPAGGLVFYFDIPPQSQTIRGLAAIFSNELSGCSPEQIISVPSDFFIDNPVRST
jgi:cysteine desulfuration protein SufE